MEIFIKETDRLGHFEIAVKNVKTPFEHTDAKNKIALKLLELSGTKLKDKSFMQALEEYVKAVQDYSDKEMGENYANLVKLNMTPKFEIKIGKIWAKIVKTDAAQRSVFAFIKPDTGDIYKPASWDIAAKGIRGNIYDEKPPVSAGALYRYR